MERKTQYGNPEPKAQRVFAVLRICLALLLLWAFFDKVFGLGFATLPEKSWLAGNSPTEGFLKNGTTGPLKAFYGILAGNVFVDWLFMLGLLLIGLALLLGVGIRIAAVAGSLLFFMMWTALLPPKNHPFLDEHIFFIIALIGILVSDAGDVLGFGKRWKNSKIVKKFRFLQ